MTSPSISISPTPNEAIYRDDYDGVLLYWGPSLTKATRVIVAFDGSRPLWAIQYRGHGDRWSVRYFVRSRVELERLLPGPNWTRAINAHLPEFPSADQYPCRGHLVR